MDIIPVLYCLRAGCGRPLGMTEYKTGYCNAHQAPKWIEAVSDDSEVVAIYGGIIPPDLYGAAVQERDTCTCGGWIHPDHWDMGVRECVKCTGRAKADRQKTEAEEALANGLGRANGKIKR